MNNATKDKPKSQKKVTGGAAGATQPTPKPKEVKVKPPSVVKGALLSMDLDSLKQRMSHEVEVRKVLNTFIKDNFTEVDSARVHVRKDCPKKSYCQDEEHLSKPSLGKSGAEKLLSVFGLRVRVVKDEDTWSMSGSHPNLFCYTAEVLNQDSDVVGWGKGACDAKEKYGNQNNAIKIAKKRATVDAVITALGLSDMFTQDLNPKDDDAAILPKGESNTNKVAALEKLIKSAKTVAAFEKIRPQIIEELGSLPQVFKDKITLLAKDHKQTLTTPKNAS